MADNTSLLSISRNLEISQSNRKNVPTENESYSMTGCPDEKPSEILQEKSLTNTEVERDTEIAGNQDEECLKAEKVIKALLSIRDEVQDDREPIEENASVPSVPASETSVSSDPVEKGDGSNSEDAASSLSVVDGNRKRRRRRRIRKRKVKGTDTNELSTTDIEVQSTASVPDSPSSTTCSSSFECAELNQENVGRDQLSVELMKGTDSAISQDETYQDFVTQDFLLDHEQRMIKENLFIEHEKLAKEVSRFELELNAQVEKSEAMEQSLQDLKTNNKLLEQEKAGLLGDIIEKEGEIASLKEQALSLKVICDELWIWKNESEEKAPYIELDHLKSKLIYKEDELEYAKMKHQNECMELAKNHGSYLADILTEAQEINMTLYTALNSGETKPEIHKTRNVLQLLKQLSEDVLTLSDKSNALEVNVKLLRKEIDGQTRMMSKLTNDKKLLKGEVVQLSNQNKELVKERAKLEREKQTLKAEGVRAKSATQTFKARVEELKASSRSAKRENEIAQREKQNIVAVLKNLGVDYKSLMLNRKSDMDKNKQENPGSNFDNAAAKVVEKLQRVVVNTDVVKDVKGLDATTNAVHTEQTCMLNDIFARITKHGFCLKEISELKSYSRNFEMLFQSLYCECGCYEDRVMVKNVSENFPLFVRSIGFFGKEKISKKKTMGEKTSDLNSEADDMTIATENFIDNIEKLKAENRSLKLEQTKLETSLENYKELVRGYSHIVQDLEDRVAGAREMRYINSVLDKYSVLLKQRKDFPDLQIRWGVHMGINLIHAMFQRLKSFAGNPFNVNTSVPSSEPVPMKSTEEMDKYMKEKLAYEEYRLSLLKNTLAKKRKEADEIGIRIDVVLFGREESLLAESLAREKEKGSSHAGFNSENGKDFDNAFGSNVSTLLGDELLAVVVNLVQCKEQLLLGVEESVELEEKLDKLGESFREFMDVLESKCFSECKKADIKLENKRKENEFCFKEARVGLLEKQIALLKSERKACLKALDRYEESMKTESASNRMATALATVLLASSFPKPPEPKCDLQAETVVIGTKVQTASLGPFGNGTGIRFNRAGSGV